MELNSASRVISLTLLLLHTGVAQVCVQPPSGLVGWWRAENDVTDAAGGNHGTAVGNLAFVPGTVGQAFQFDATSAFVRVPYHANLAPTAAISVEAWVKPRDPQQLFGPIVKLAGANQFSGYALEFHVPPLASLWLNILGDWTHGGTGVLVSDVWTHVAGTYDGACQRFYINGIVNSENCGTSGTITQPPVGTELHIGHDPAIGSRYYNGAADEVSVYNRALSASEVYSIYNAGSAGKCSAPRHNVCLLYDANKVVKGGSTLPVKLQLCDVDGNNLSSSSVTLHATSVTQTSTSIDGPVEDAGNANPDNGFRYVGSLGGTGGYIFNLSTKGLATGSFRLNFTVAGDPTTYYAPFQVK